jgi:circadian clock protein KaiB
MSAEKTLRLRLYVAGESPNSVAAERNVRRLLSELAKGAAVLDVLDVLTDPEAGLRAGVFLTPTLVKLAPAPERRILGSLHDAEQLRDVLGLSGAGRDRGAEG